MPERLTEQELKDKYPLVPKQGSVWRHKKTGNLYCVRDCGINEATLEPVVIYFLHSGGIFWVRPLAEWMEKFESTKEAI